MKNFAKALKGDLSKLARLLYAEWKQSIRGLELILSRF
jgi:hypothetical protein